MESSNSNQMTSVNVNNIDQGNSEIILLTSTQAERSMAIGTQKLYDLVHVLPKEVNSLCEDIVTTQKIVLSDTKNLSARLDGFQLFLTEWGKEMKRLDTDLSSISALEDWIKITTSEISQLKSQALFLNQCVDSINSEDAK